ncbi:hypothetical protein [Cryobacterium melibiosiphilum]|uniref:hypothetical protein n=1 Tax=Cryobacterium melibiosiphilum TaxID=995039 RepID=UPI0011C23BE4|nr:hypothetical protein [Cryobacterium melibiosiphilum]
MSILNNVRQGGIGSIQSACKTNFRKWAIDVTAAIMRRTTNSVGNERAFNQADTIMPCAIRLIGWVVTKLCQLGRYEALSQASSGRRTDLDPRY